MAARLPEDYLERVYAGVLGKLIGVYLGRPFEGWTHQQIMAALGPIRYYVHDHPNMPASPFDPSLGSARDYGLPLVVTDDDVSGTFVFVRALEEHGCNAEITSEQIGKTWLNQIVEGQTILWWGGRGISTEHTAYVNLKNGIPAPRSGAIATNGKTVAEQIGAQIFIDGWAMVAPGQPALAARLAREAGRVSHDGESVHAAVLWAAMEAEAFVSRDVDHLLDTGLAYVPKDSAIARLVADVRAWYADEKDWLKTRQKLEDKYGYDKYHGICHVMPNHGVMILALLYGGHDFTEAMHIVNTCGWDTDCNSGNVGCLVALMHGVDGFSGKDGVDWRGPVADRALISSADGGFAIANAASVASEVANLGRRIAGHDPSPQPKDGAQFHFTLPGSVQGFRGVDAQVSHEYDAAGVGGLVIKHSSKSTADGTLTFGALTDTFAGKEVLKMPLYPLMASPLVSPGQTLEAKVRIARNDDNGIAAATAPVKVALRLLVYAPGDELVTRDGEPVDINPGEEKYLEWTIPDAFNGQPIQSIGIAIYTQAPQPLPKVILDKLGWTGTPRMVLQKPSVGEEQQHKHPGHFWLKAWVKAVDSLYAWTGAPFCIVQNRGEGLLIYGTRDWMDYRVRVEELAVKLGGPAGVAVRVRGLNRYYAVVFTTSSLEDSNSKTVALVKALDEQRIVLASAPFDWALDEKYSVTIQAAGSRIVASIEGYDVRLRAEDGQFVRGGLGLVVTDGALSAGAVAVEPVDG